MEVMYLSQKLLIKMQFMVLPGAVVSVWLPLLHCYDHHGKKNLVQHVCKCNECIA